MSVKTQNFKPCLKTLCTFSLCDPYNKRPKVSEVFCCEETIDGVVATVAGCLQWTCTFLFVLKRCLSTYCLLLAFFSLSPSWIEGDAISVPWGVGNRTCHQWRTVSIVHLLQVRCHRLEPRWVSKCKFALLLIAALKASLRVALSLS